MGSPPLLSVSSRSPQHYLYSNKHSKFHCAQLRTMGILQPLLLTSCLAGMISASCSFSSPDPKATAKDDYTYQDTCITALESLLMAAHFSQDTVNLPKVATLFWDHADEERSHAIQFITYLRMRGATNNDFFGPTSLQPKRKHMTG